MTSERLGEMFEGDSADMCARKFPLAQTRERGPPSALGENIKVILSERPFSTDKIYPYYITTIGQLARIVNN